MKARTLLILLGLGALALASAVWADFLPLIHSRPTRDNPFDPASHPQELDTPPPTPKPTATSTQVCGSPTDSSTYGFESGVAGWSANTGAGYVPVSLFQGSTPSAQVCDGFGSLCGYLTYTAGGGATQVTYSLSVGGVDWTGRVLTGQVLFPAGMSGASGSLFVKTTSSYTWNPGATVDAPANGGWVSMTLDMSSVTSPNQVEQVGFNFTLPSAAASGNYDLCVDTLNLSAAPTATVTPTATPSETPGGAPATATPTPTPIFTPGGPCGVSTDASAIAGFESGIGAWTSNNCCTYTVADLFAGTVPSLQVCEGVGSLCGTATYAGSGTSVEYRVDPASPYLTFTATAVITAEVLFPPGMGDTLAQLYVKVGSGYTQYTASGGLAPGNVPASGGWVQLSLNLNAAYDANAGSAVPVPSTAGMVTAEEVGMDIDQLSGASSGSFTVCLDAVTAN
jgi:hypothetical protein